MAWAVPTSQHSHSRLRCDLHMRNNKSHQGCAQMGVEGQHTLAVRRVSGDGMQRSTPWRLAGCKTVRSFPRHFLRGRDSVDIPRTGSREFGGLGISAGREGTKVRLPARLNLSPPFAIKSAQSPVIGHQVTKSPNHHQSEEEGVSLQMDLIVDAPSQPGDAGQPPNSANRLAPNHYSLATYSIPTQASTEKELSWPRHYVCNPSSAVSV